MLSECYGIKGKKRFKSCPQRKCSWLKEPVLPRSSTTAGLLVPESIEFYFYAVHPEKVRFLGFSLIIHKKDAAKS